MVAAVLKQHFNSQLLEAFVAWLQSVWLRCYQSAKSNWERINKPETCKEVWKVPQQDVCQVKVSVQMPELNPPNLPQRFGEEMNVTSSTQTWCSPSEFSNSLWRHVINVSLLVRLGNGSEKTMSQVLKLHTSSTFILQILHLFTLILWQQFQTGFSVTHPDPLWTMDHAV